MTESQKYVVVTILDDKGLSTLRKQSQPVAFTVLGDGSVCLDIETNCLIEQLKKYVIEHNGLGMSAIQLGVDKAIFVMRKPYDSDNVIAVINPTITKAAAPVVELEGCFSIPLPDKTGALVKRASKIVVQYEAENGDRIKDELLVGMNARVFQHELDHLNGELMIDKSKFNGWSNI